MSDEKKKLYPYCQNSRRWIDVPFYLDLPKTCIAKVCNEKCACFKLKKPTKYLVRRLLKYGRQDVL